MLDRATVSVGRIGYRVANGLIELDRQLRRSRGRGVKVIVEDASNRVLLVRHTYGSRLWTLPGGRVRKGEPFVDAATRELAEELGITDQPLLEVGSYPHRCARRIETVGVCHCFGPSSPLDPRPIEIAEHRWFDRAGLPPDLDNRVPAALGLLDGFRAELKVEV